LLRSSLRIPGRQAELLVAHQAFVRPSRISRDVGRIGFRNLQNDRNSGLSMAGQIKGPFWLRKLKNLISLTERAISREGEHMRVGMSHWSGKKLSV
jgi:hypothetical protein